MEKIDKRLIKIDNILAATQSKINFGLLTPINLEEEKVKFFENNDYNPQFKYKNINIDFKKQYKMLKSLRFKDTPMDKIFKEKSDEIYYYLKLLENLGTKNITKYSIKIFGRPNYELIEKSNNLIKCKTCNIRKPHGNISSYKALKEFRKIIKDLNIDWQIKRINMVANAMVIPSKRMLVINKNSKFSSKQIKRLTAHEIYTHVLRAEFGMRQPYKIFATGLANYEATEEGLALYKERRVGVLEKADLRKYAGRVIAVNESLNNSFSNTYKKILEFAPKSKAWDLTVRAKRGLSDTGKKGAFTKDIIYFKGFLEVNNFIKNQSCLHLLHYGKVSTKQALVIPLIENLNNPYLILEKKFKHKIKELSLIY